MEKFDLKQQSLIFLAIIGIIFSYSTISYPQTQKRFVEKYKIHVADPSDLILEAKFSSDGTKLLIVTRKSAQVRSAETGDLISTFENLFDFKSPVFRWQPSGSKILQFSAWQWDKLPAILWDGETGRKISLLEEERGVINAQWNSRGDRILTAGNYTGGSLSKDFTYSVRDDSGKVIWSKKGTPYDFHQIRFSEGDNGVFISTKQRKHHKPIEKLDVETGDVLSGFDHDVKNISSTNYAIFAGESPNGEYLCGQIDFSKGVTCWRADDDSKTIYSFLDTKKTGDTLFLDFSPDSKNLAVLKSRQKSIDIIDTETGRVNLSIEDIGSVEFITRAISRFRYEGSGYAYGDLWSSDGTYFIASNAKDEVGLWNLDSKKLIAKRKAIWKSDYDWFVGTLPVDYEVFSFNPRNDLLLSASFNSAQVYDPSSGDLMFEIKNTKGLQRRVSNWSPDGDLLIGVVDDGVSLAAWAVE